MSCSGIDFTNKSKVTTYSKTETDQIVDGLNTSINTAQSIAVSAKLPVNTVILRTSTSSNGGMSYGTWKYIGDTILTYNSGANALNCSMYRRTA